jgi:hypothetical protein
MHTERGDFAELSDEQAEDWLAHLRDGRWKETNVVQVELPAKMQAEALLSGDCYAAVALMRGDWRGVQYGRALCTGGEIALVLKNPTDLPKSFEVWAIGPARKEPTDANLS